MVNHYTHYYKLKYQKSESYFMYQEKQMLTQENQSVRLPRKKKTQLSLQVLGLFLLVLTLGIYTISSLLHQVKVKLEYFNRSGEGWGRVKMEQIQRYMILQMSYIGKIKRTIHYSMQLKELKSTLKKDLTIRCTT